MKRTDTTVTAALPRTLEAAGSSALLLIHGFASYPGVMDYLASQVHASGITVSIPRLPGHGTDSVDYRSSRATDWYRRVVDSYQDLRCRYRCVYVGGLSLGGILTVLVAAEFDPEGIILLAPAVRTTNRLLLLTPVIRPFVKRLAGSYEAHGQDLSDPDINYLAEEYWSGRWPGPSAELLKLQRRSRRALGRVKAPCLIIVSKADSAVPPGVAGYIEQRIASESRTVVLERSKHTLVTDTEKEIVAREVVSQLRTWESRK